MRIEARTGSAVIAGLHGLLEPGQRVRPELGEEITQPGQALEAVSLTEDGYQQSILLSAARERVWDAVGTAAGPRQWWTTDVTGSAGEGGELRFGFAGLPEEMTMLVVSSRRPASVSGRAGAQPEPGMDRHRAQLRARRPRARPV